MSDRPSPGHWWRDPALIYFEELGTGERRYVPSYQRPEWQLEAACRGQMVDGRSPWFSSHKLDVAHAKLLCSTCPVRTECHEAGEGEQGLWG